MSIWKIITLILTSTVVSSIITGIVSYLIQNNSYKKEYYKEIIKKRIIVYENLEILYSIMLIAVKDDDGRKVHSFFKEQKYFDTFFDSINISKQNGLWLSQKTSDILSLINSLYIDISFKIGYENIGNPKSIEYGKNNFELISNLTKELRRNILLDFKEFHKLDFDNLIGSKNTNKKLLIFQDKEQKGIYTTSALELK